MKNRRMVAIFCGAGLVLGLSLTAMPANAAGCVRGDYRTTAGDYARTTDVSGTCGEIGVRHRYDPVWSSSNYWTYWYTTFGSAVSTPVARELFASEHIGR